jgi:hypothetical protein
VVTLLPERLDKNSQPGRKQRKSCLEMGCLSTLHMQLAADLSGCGFYEKCGSLPSRKLSLDPVLDTFPAHGSGIESSDIDNDLFNDVARCRPRSNLPRYVHILHRVSETSTCE